jgi:small-conductance mechanosensitive channel
MHWQDLLDHIERYDVHLFTLAGTEITVSSGFKLIAFTLLLVWASRRVRDWTVNRALHRTHMDLGTREAVGSIMRYAVLVVGAMLILQNAGINLSAFSVLAGAVGVGVGFGLQNIISNFVSGLIIMLERPIKIGDRVEVGGIEGVVQEIGPRRTTVVTNDRISILVPNQRFILDNVVNQVYTEQPIRLRIAVQVASGTDTQLMHDLLVDAARSHPDVLKEPAPEALVTTLGGPATAYELAVWHEARGPRRQQLASDLAYQVAQRLKAHEIKPA